MSEQKLRILVCLQHFRKGWGGTPESILFLADYLGTCGVDTDVISYDGFYSGIRNLTDLPDEFGDSRSATSLQLHAYAAILLAGSWNPMAPYLAFRAHLNRVRLIYAPKGNLAYADFKRLRDIKKIAYLICIEYPLIRACHAVLFSSRKEKKACVVPARLLPSRRVIGEPIRIAPEPTILPLMPAGNHTPRRLNIGFLAEIAPRKGLLELARGIRLWAAIHPHPSFCLRIAGAPRPGSERYAAQCRSVLQDLEDDGFVEWIGPQRGENRNTFYNSLDLFVVPSLFESWGLTPLEALVRGIPVMCSPYLGVLEYVSSGLAILQLRNLAPDTITSALHYYSAHHDRYRALALRTSGSIFPVSFRTSVTKKFLDLLNIPSHDHP